MMKNFYSFVYDIFYRFSNTQPGQVDITFSREVISPILTVRPENQIILPLPMKIDAKYAFFGMLFDESESGQKGMWALFLAMLYHAAAHVAISNYTIYDSWRKSKTPELAWKVIDFIEDIRIKKYIMSLDGEIWNNVENIETILFNERKIKKKQSLQTKIAYGELVNHRELELIHNQIFSNKEEEEKKMISAANFLYQNSQIIKDRSIFCYEHKESKFPIKIEEDAPALAAFGNFEEQAMDLSDLWQSGERSKRQILRKYQKHLKNLNFDSVMIPQGNIQSYSKIKSDNLPIISRIRQQIRAVSDLADDPNVDKVGQLNMQMAIQSIASENSSIDVFERDEIRHGGEAWIILVDKSASMNLRFDIIKEFTVCVAESANELTKKSDEWALYSFDNNFQILKDFKEKYDTEVQSRIGNLKPGGLSLLPDAIELAQRVLEDNPSKRKFIFVITDGHASGYSTINETFTKIVKKVEHSETILVAIGVTKKNSRSFRNNARGRNLRNLVAKFITAYRSSSSDM